MSRPAISRYSATTPELLQWFSTFNKGRYYRDQVKPFGFLFSLSAKLDFDGEQTVGRRGPGRPKKVRPMKPTAPFDRHHAKAIALAFDRETGEPVPPSVLKSYADALAHYHIQPESKFLNADYGEQGTTLRRHVEMTGTHHIGKESHDWERQALIGLNLDSEIAYGLSDDGNAQLVADCTTLAVSMGKARAAKAIGISLSRLRRLLEGRAFPDRKTAQILAIRLPDALQRCEELRAEQTADLQRLREMVQSSGLREAARQLGVDPSNLRRALRKL